MQKFRPPSAVTLALLSISLTLGFAAHATNPPTFTATPDYYFDERDFQDFSYTDAFAPSDFSYRAPTAVKPEFAQFGSTLDQSFGALSMNVVASSNPLLRPLTRLDTSISRNLSWLYLRLGDSISNSDGWDHPVRFGGLQVGSLQNNMADAIIAPELSAAGPAVIPTTADILSNHSSLLPHVAANGQVTMTLTDVLGRPYEVTRPLFVNDPLMSKGQFGYSFSMGRVRENYLLADNDYGKMLTSGTVRYGLKNTVTVDLHAAQLEGDVAVFGGGIAKKTSSKSSVTASYAGSRSPTDQGWFWRAGYQYDGDDVAFAVRSRVQSPGYRDLGTLDVIPVQRRTLASAAVKMGSLGDVAVAGVSQTYTDQTSMDYVSLSHSIALYQLWTLTTSLAYAPVDETASGVLISFAHPFGRSTAANSNATFARADVLMYQPIPTVEVQARARAR
jgi:outer membrane usher protein FimD/PapC